MLLQEQKLDNEGGWLEIGVLLTKIREGNNTVRITYSSHLAMLGNVFSFSSLSLDSSSLYNFLYSAPIRFSQSPLGLSSKS